VLAPAAPLWLVVAVWTVSGLGAGLINPILSSVMYERIPGPLLGRAWALAGTLAWAGIPLGGPVGGVLAAVLGLGLATLVLAAGYLAATTLPALRPEWRGLDRPTATPPPAGADRAGGQG
jgi:MFS family permease